MRVHGERLTFRIPGGPRSRRLDVWVVELLHGAGVTVSRSTVGRWMGEGRVLVEGVPGKPSGRPVPGARIDVDPAPPAPSSAEADPRVPVEVLYQDDHLLVVNKPANLVVHPARGHLAGTLVNGLLALDAFDPSVVDLSDPEATLRPGIVHRLDKDTSGVLVVARTARAREGLKDLFARHDIERAYQAVVVGSATDATYDTPYGRHPTHRLKFSTRGGRTEKRAVTHVRVRERLAEGRASLVVCRLETGRTHQIRVHLSECGKTPVLGDALYGPRRGDGGVFSLGRALGRHWLHAGFLGFVHPVTGEAMRFEAPLPAELEEVLMALRRLPSL